MVVDFPTPTFTASKMIDQINLTIGANFTVTRSLFNLSTPRMFYSYGVISEPSNTLVLGFGGWEGYQTPSNWTDLLIASHSATRLFYSGLAPLTAASSVSSAAFTKNGVIYTLLCGGYYDTIGIPVSSIIQFNHNTRIYTMTDLILSQARSDTAAVVFNNEYLLVIGGYTGLPQAPRSTAIDIFSLTNMTYLKRIDLKEGRNGPGVAVLGQYVYVAGGSFPSLMSINSVEVINTADWTVSYPRDSVSSYNGSAYLLSGSGGYGTAGIGVPGVAAFFAGGRNVQNLETATIDWFTCGNNVLSF